MVLFTPLRPSSLTSREKTVTKGAVVGRDQDPCGSREDQSGR